MIDILNMDAVRRVEKVAESILRNNGLGLHEIYARPEDIFLLDHKELAQAFAQDLFQLAMVAKQGESALQQFAKWEALQPMPGSDGR